MMSGPPHQSARLGSDRAAGDIEHRSPLGYHHLNLLGRYSFALPEAQRRGESRPLHDPTGADDDLWG
jgi:hypothetical protein